MSTAATEIFHYLDVRQYLKEFQASKQATDPGYSKSHLSRLLGMPNTRSYFNDVLSGKPITSSFVERFVQALELPDKAAKYFRLLVKFNQTTSQQERELAYDQLLQYRRDTVTPQAIDQMEYYRHWYHGAIRSLLDILDTSGDAKLIKAHLNDNITKPEIEASLNLLKRLDMIRPNEMGHLKPSHPHISTDPYSQHQLVLQYQCQQIERLKEHVLKNGLENKSPANTSTNYITLSHQAYAKIEEKLQQFKAEIRAIVNDDSQPAEALYLLTNALTPLASKKESLI